MKSWALESDYLNLDLCSITSYVTLGKLFKSLIISISSPLQQTLVNLKKKKSM